MSSLCIQFDTDLVLRFDIESHAIADLWQKRFEDRHSWPLDDPSRFYGLRDPVSEHGVAVQRLQCCIDVINAYQPIIERPVDDLADQDTLNYLHSIFEQYHGLLDQQNTVWWQAAPTTVQQALANLNIAVHRMESVKTNQPRIVCTWFGMPKDHVMDLDMMHRHGSLTHDWGGVYLNYVEIGKTLEDLAKDNDHWIGQDAVQQFQHYSADFNIRFYDRAADVDLVRSYWQQHQDFFTNLGIDHWDHAAAFPYRFKIAQLQTEQSRQSVLAELSRVDSIIDIHIE